jgi:predicted DNA-binding transcriptional regulator AlpA
MATRSGDLPELLEPSDVTARLGVSRTWLYDAAKAGLIPLIRLCGGEGPLRFVPEDIERWLDDARIAWTSGRSTRPTSRAEVAQRLGVRARRGS